MCFNECRQGYKDVPVQEHQIQFSIVIPVRNGANYIEQTLKSIQAQTYTNFNVFVLENCSEDDTVEIIDPRITIVPAAQSLPIEANWKRILELDLNEYLVLLCHDDFLCPEFLQEINDLIAKHPDASLYHTYFHFVDTQNKPFASSQPVPYRETADDFLFNAHRFKENFLGSGYVMRSADFKQVDGYPAYPKLLFADGFCYYQLTRLSYKICSPRYLYHFTRHPDSTGHTSRLMEFVQAAQIYLDDLAKTTHFDVPERRLQTYTFLLGFFIRPKYRLLIGAAIRAQQNRQQKLEECHRMQKVIDEAFASDPLFKVRNRTTRLYESVNNIGWFPLRMMVFMALNMAVGAGLFLLRPGRKNMLQPLAIKGE
jgi:glycosyltransferase involved in cell wall biosynthesis